MELLKRSTVRVVYGAGSLLRLGELARLEGARRVLLVTDPGIVAAGHVARALESFDPQATAVEVFDGSRENPTTREVQAAVEAARRFGGDFLVAVGGGSAMDCMKGANLLLSGGGSVQDYRGDASGETLARRNPLLPMIAVPTTAGTGSEAQSFALISDPVTHEKMACGDRRPPQEGGLRPRWAILDPDLTRTAPRNVACAVGIDAIAHAIETSGSTARTPESLEFSAAAWRLLSRSYAEWLADPNLDRPRADMLLGAHLAGAAIERSMLGAAHACANPLTARHGVAHGRAVGLMLPHVIRFNAEDGRNPYEALMADAEALAAAVEALMGRGGLPRRLRDVGVPNPALPELARQAAGQWTATFNPRPVTSESLERLYASAW